MKKNFFIGVLVFPFFANMAFSQDIEQSQVPSLIVNSFQQSFPKSFDIEWELDGGNYKVEFELGLLGFDHEAWYDKTGKLLRHKEEISKSDLPQKVLTKLNTDFNEYLVDDIKKISDPERVIYIVELKSLTEEWKVVLDIDGNVLTKVAD